MKKESSMKEIGIVASGNRPMNLKFYTQEQIVDDYVMVEVQDERIIYEITGVDAYNSRMEDIEFVRHILPGEDYSKYNVYRVNATLLGGVKDGIVISVGRWFVVPPGKVVKTVDKEDIALIYGVEQGKLKQRIGRMMRHEQIPVWINFPQLLTTHMAMVGRSGQGKSNLVKVLLKRLPMNYIVFTKVNEYLNMKNAVTDNLQNALLRWNADSVKRIFELNNSEMQNLKDCIKHFAFQGKIHTLKLSRYIQQYYAQNKRYLQVSLFEYEQEVEESLPKYAESLCKKLESLSIEIDFDKHIENISKSRIINMQGISDKEEEITIFSFLSNLLSSRRKNYVETGEALALEERIVVFIEEAHNYVPSTKSSACKDVIRQVAREGRKLGIHLVLLSQRPRHLDPTALSQCGSIVSFNLTNPEDIDYLMANSNFYGDYYKNTIKELKIGECMIVSDFMTRGINCKVDLDCIDIIKL